MAETSSEKNMEEAPQEDAFPQNDNEMTDEISSESYLEKNRKKERIERRKKKDDRIRNLPSPALRKQEKRKFIAGQYPTQNGLYGET